LNIPKPITTTGKNLSEFGTTATNTLSNVGKKLKIN
jgi:hypothetical protein